MYILSRYYETKCATVSRKTVRSDEISPQTEESSAHEDNSAADNDTDGMYAR